MLQIFQPLLFTSQNGCAILQAPFNSSQFVNMEEPLVIINSIWICLTLDTFWPFLRSVMLKPIYEQLWHLWNFTVH